jgi:preprotein translocase subunit SecD
VYRGRAEFRKPVGQPTKKTAASAKEAQRRQTIAERKAASVGAGSGDTSNDGKES